MKCITKDNVEIWKRLTASEPVKIGGAWLNSSLDSILPCIISTTNPKLVAILTKSDLFKTQIVTIFIEEYIGPPGTQREDLMKQEIYMSSDKIEELK